MEKSKKLFISKNLNIDPKKTLLIGDFITFCAKSLPIENGFCVKVVDDRDKHEIGTTGAYRVGQNDIRVYARRRALVDVLRSIAHEMTHMMQDEQGMITGPVQDAGGFHEDQANAKAGELIKLYARKPGRRAIYESVKRKII